MWASTRTVRAPSTEPRACPPSRGRSPARAARYALAGSGTIELEELTEAGWGKLGTAEGDALKAAFERHDTVGEGSLSLEQFTALVQEFSMLGDGFLPKAKRAPPPDVRDLAMKRPSLSDLAQERSEQLRRRLEMRGGIAEEEVDVFEEDRS